MNYELYTTKHWMVLPSFVHGILPTLMYNSNNHVAIGVVEKKQPYLVAASNGEVFRDAQVTEDGEVIPRTDGWGTSLLALMKEPFVNVVPIDGPITRNGDACSYGSKDIRDWLMEAANNKYCRAHVLVVNTPGGSVWAKNDFQQAIDYAHESGQRVYMLIDGLCASAGMYLASFCDEVYVVNLKDQLGCVGVMASFFTIKNGEKNQFDSKTYHEYYATKSVNKNKEYRDIAENDDATLLIAELDKLEDEFRKDMQAAFPEATDDHLDGKVFDAADVMGILCDGQMLLGDVVDRAFAVAKGEEEPISRTAGRNISLPEDTPDEDDDRAEVSAAAEQNNNSPKNNTTMTNVKYQRIAQILGVDELVVTEEGTFLNTPLLDKLEEKLNEIEDSAAPAAQAEGQAAGEGDGEGAQGSAGEGSQEGAGEGAQEGAQEGTSEGAGEGEGEGSGENAGEGAGEGTGEGEGSGEDEGAGEGDGEGAEKAAQEAAEKEAAEKKAIEAAGVEIDRISETLRNAEQMIANKDKEIAELKADVDQKEIDFKAKDETIATLTKERDDANAQLSTLNSQLSEKDATIAERDKTIEALRAEVKELSEKETPMAGADAGVPAGNGTGEAPKQKGSRIKRGMTYAEIRKAMADE